MDFQQMRYFIHIYEERSLSRAAAKLYISQQGLSKSILTLEQEHKVQFFLRTQKGLVPTREGQIMYDKCRDMLKEYDDLTDCFTRIAEKDTLLRLGATSLIYCEELYDNILNYHDHHPEVRLEVVALGYYDCEKHLENNRLDLCITIRPDNHFKYGFRHIWSDKFRLYLHKDHPLVKKECIYLQDLVAEKIILLSRETKGGSMIWNLMKEQGFFPQVTLSTSQIGLAFEYIKRQRGIALLPSYSIPPSYRDLSDTICRDIVDLNCLCDLGIMYLREKTLTEQEASFISYFSEVATQKGAAGLCRL